MVQGVGRRVRDASSWRYLDAGTASGTLKSDPNYDSTFPKRNAIWRTLQTSSLGPEPYALQLSTTTHLEISG